jgi:lipid-binding SYLF domain-containing protein
MKNISIIFCMILALSAGGCASTGGSSADKRTSVLKMKDDVLAKLYNEKPSVEAELSNAPGYAVFSNVNINLIFASVGGGCGVVTDNNTAEHTFMKMGEVGVGFGLGAKDFRAVFVFHNVEAMDRFTEHGWAVGAQADAAAKANEKGAAVGGEAIIDNVSIYQLTESGLALQATVKGTKYWKDDALN